MKSALKAISDQPSANHTGWLTADG